MTPNDIEGQGETLTPVEPYVPNLLITRLSVTGFLLLHLPEFNKLEFICNSRSTGIL